MRGFTQENRLISIDTPFPRDELLLTSFAGSEYLSGLFEFNVTVLSANPAIDLRKLVGEPVTLTIHNEQSRTFNGYVNQFSFGEICADSLREYHLTVVPWLWFLSKTHNQRIFQNKSVKEIVTQIFADLGFNDYKFNIKGGDTPREYCIQYGESDLNFVSRLLEEEGITYYFLQEGDKHTMIILDKVAVFEFCLEKEVAYTKGNQPGAQITRWEHEYRFGKGKWTLNDYNFKEPSRPLLVDSPTSGKFSSNSKFEHYEYPGLYDLSAGAQIVKLRADAQDAPRDVINAESDCSSFYAGGKFNLTGHESKGENAGYLITNVRHRAYDNGYYTGNDQDSGYQNAFTCIPENVHFRPPLVHYKPVMRGPQSAMVTGPAGEEIHVDEFGRIKVQFIWDREGKHDENSSCYLRVVQSWAGNKWGASFIPRIGHEVIVDFLDGDPDRPLVTGSVYNGANKPPYGAKTQSGIKTRSTKSGTPENCNELRFDDLKGSEQIFIHAEKNMDTEVENDETHWVGADRTKTIDHDENSTIGNDRNKSVGNNQTESIGKNKTIDVGENHQESIGKNMTIIVAGDLKESVDGQYTENVTKEYGLTAKAITLTADTEIILKTGSAKIIMKSNGDITLSGANINVKGSGNVVIKGSKTSVN
jgi:type VI secretion system secreted protein VgrG